MTRSELDAALWQFEIDAYTTDVSVRPNSIILTVDCSVYEIEPWYYEIPNSDELGYWPTPETEHYIIDVRYQDISEGIWRKVSFDELCKLMKIEND